MTRKTKQLMSSAAKQRWVKRKMGEKKRIKSSMTLLEYYAGLSMVGLRAVDIWVSATHDFYDGTTAEKLAVIAFQDAKALIEKLEKEERIKNENTNSRSHD